MQHEFGQQLKQQLIFSNANNCPCFSQLNLPNIAKASTISTYHEVRDINTSFRAKSLVLMGRNQSQGCWALPPWINIENHGRTEYQWFTMRSYKIMDSYGMIQSMNRINCGPTVFQNHTNTHTNTSILELHWWGSNAELLEELSRQLPVEAGWKHQFDTHNQSIY